MKKEYMTPSLKVMKIEMSSLMSGSAKSDVDWDAGDSGDNTGLLFNDYENSNTTGPDWDF
jgi:hypothetical protein